MTVVSAIIPAYNCESTIQRAITSAQQQTVEGVQVIVVDDASDDRTRDFARAVLRGEDRLICHGRNQGGSTARNTGIKASDGKYLAFLDADDVWVPEKLSTQLQYLDDTTERVVANYCDFEVPRANAILRFVDDTIHKSRGFERGEDIIPHVLSLDFDFGGASTLVVKSDAATDINGFDDRFPRHQDWEFLLRLAEVGEVTYTDHRLVRKYHTSDPSYEKTKLSKQLLLEKFDSSIDAFGLDREEIVRRHEFELAKVAMRNGMFATAVTHLRTAAVPDPRDTVGLGYAMLRGIRHHLM